MLTETFSSITTTGVVKFCYYICYLSFQTDFFKSSGGIKGKEYMHLNSGNIVLHVGDQIIILGVTSHMYSNMRANPIAAGSCGIAF
jgi:hypothetical protein